MIAYTNEPTSAARKVPTWTPGTMLAETRNTRIWSTRTETPVRISDRGATSASTTGRTSALSSAMTITTITPSRTRSTVMFGSSQAVARNEIVETTSVMIRRFRSALRPPRHSHSTRSCVAYNALRFISPLLARAGPMHGQADT